MSCILCKRTGGIFNIYTIYSNASHTVRDDIIEILGVDAESYLCTTDCVCNVCMNMLENVAKLKWRLWRVISNESQDCKPINLGKIWELFATFKREDDREDDGVICRTPTPNLLVLSHSRDYNPTLEEQIQIMERNRSLSRASSGVGRSDVSEASEIIEIFNKKKKVKKRRKKGSYKWTHRKRHGTSSTTSEFNNRSSSLRRKVNRQTDTPLSDRSYMSCYTLDREGSPFRMETPGRYAGTRTRSLSREAEREMRYQEQLEHMKFYCVEDGCPLYFDDLDVLNHHKIMDHDVMALHYCDECHQKYTTAEHLKLHKKIHEVGPFWCLLCFSEMKNQEALQEHLEEHASYSVRCKYCDKSFLSKSLRENHLKTAHTDNKERILYKKKIIMDRIDKDEGDKASETTSGGSNNFRFRVFMSPFTDVECDCVELDVTSENLARMNVAFTTCSEPPGEVSEVVESETVQIPVET